MIFTIIAAFSTITTAARKSRLDSLGDRTFPETRLASILAPRFEVVDECQKAENQSVGKKQNKTILISLVGQKWEK